MTVARYVAVPRTHVTHTLCAWKLDWQQLEPTALEHTRHTVTQVARWCIHDQLLLTSSIGGYQRAHLLSMLPKLLLICDFKELGPMHYLHENPIHTSIPLERGWGHKHLRGSIPPLYPLDLRNCALAPVSLCDKLANKILAAHTACKLPFGRRMPCKTHACTAAGVRTPQWACRIVRKSAPWSPVDAAPRHPAACCRPSVCQNHVVQR